VEEVQMFREDRAPPLHFPETPFYIRHALVEGREVKGLVD
jgi:hypothetical protein